MLLSKQRVLEVSKLGRGLSAAGIYMGHMGQQHPHDLLGLVLRQSRDRLPNCKLLETLSGLQIYNDFLLGPTLFSFHWCTCYSSSEESSNDFEGFGITCYVKIAESATNRF